MKVNLSFIKKKRNEMGYTLQYMADVLGYKKASTYALYENGEYTLKADMLPILANVLKCNIEDFFC